MKNGDNKSMAKELWDTYVKTMKKYNTQLTPNENDNPFTIVAKRVGQVVIVIASLLLSPVILIVVLLIFITAL